MLPTPEPSDAFAKLKQDVCDSGALKIPNPEKAFVLLTDASSIAVGAVLKKLDGDEEICLSSSIKASSTPKYCDLPRPRRVVLYSLAYIFSSKARPNFSFLFSQVLETRPLKFF